MKKSKIINKRNIKNYGYNWYGKNGKRRKIIKILRKDQDGKCKICKLPLGTDETVDHISEGGAHYISNMQLLHRRCHTEKDRENVKLFSLIGRLRRLKKKKESIKNNYYH